MTGINGYATQADMQAAVDAGTLNLFGDSPAFDAAAASVVTRRDGDARLYGFDTRLSGDLRAMTHGMLKAAVGVEFRNEEFSDYFDPLTESGAVMGIGGTSGEGDRDVAATYGELGRVEEARAEVAEFNRLSPQTSGEAWKQRLPYKNQAVSERLIDSLRKSGFK